MAAILWLKLKRMRQDLILYFIMTFMAVFLTFVFGNAMFGGGAQRVYVADNDKSEFSAAFLGALDTDSYMIENKDETEVQTGVAKGEALAAIIVPEGFGESLADASAAVTLLRTADSPDVMALESAVRSAYQSAAHATMLQSGLDDLLTPAGIDAPDMESIQAALDERADDKAITVTYEIMDTDGFDEGYANNIHYLMGFNIFFVMFSIVFTMGSILEDKKLRTWNRIRISPLPGRAVLAGNFIPAYIVGLLQMAIVFFLGQMLFGVNLGDALLPVFAVFAVFVLAATCLGLLMATALRTLEQMSAATPVLIVATSMLGGCMWPLSIVNSDLLLGIANAMPQKWALEAVENLAVYHVGFGDIALNLGVLFGMALVLFAVSMVLYNKKQRV